MDEALDDWFAAPLDTSKGSKGSETKRAGAPGRGQGLGFGWPFSLLARTYEGEVSCAGVRALEGGSARGW